VLDGEEELAVAGGEEWGVGTGELDGDFFGECRGGLAGRISSVGLHLAVAGKDVELQVQTARFL